MHQFRAKQQGEIHAINYWCFSWDHVWPAKGWEFLLGDDQCLCLTRAKESIELNHSAKYRKTTSIQRVVLAHLVLKAQRTNFGQFYRKSVKNLRKLEFWVKNIVVFSEHHDFYSPRSFGLRLDKSRKIQKKYNIFQHQRVHWVSDVHSKAKSWRKKPRF